MPEFTIASTNPKTGQGSLSFVRIYKNGKLIAEEGVPKRSPLKYLQSLKKSKHLVNLERQLLKHGLTLTDVGFYR